MNFLACLLPQITYSVIYCKEIVHKNIKVEKLQAELTCEPWSVANCALIAFNCFFEPFRVLIQDSSGKVTKHSYNFQIILELTTAY